MTVASGEAGGRRSSFWADLREVLAERDFRKLFASRLVSQTGDGVFNAGFAAYAFFSAQSFPNPVAAVDAFAVLYLPYSLIGPFAGVFIDRWSRRQIIVYGALIRAAMVAVAGFVVLSGQTGIPLYISALAVLAVNRFFLSAVSAGSAAIKASAAQLAAYRSFAVRFRSIESVIHSSNATSVPCQMKCSSAALSA